MDEITQRFEYSNGTLKNRLHEFNKDKLAQIEYRRAVYVGAKILKNPKIKIKSFTDLQKIHYLMFSWLYEWAGEIRDYNLTKGNTDFLPVNFLEKGIDEINKQLDFINQKEIPTVYDYAVLLDRLNFLHPFREGNGRSAKIFITKLALNHHQKLDYQRDSTKMINALAKADIKGIAQQLSLKLKSP